MTATPRTTSIKKGILILLGCSVTPSRIKQNRNYSVNEVKKLVYERWLIYEQPHQDLDLCDCTFARFSEKCLPCKFIELKNRKTDRTVGLNFCISNSIQPYGQFFFFSVFWIPNFADQIHQDPVPLLCPLALSQVLSLQICRAFMETPCFFPIGGTWRL